MGGLSPSTDPGARPAPAPRRLPPARVRPPVTGALFCIRQRPRLFIRHRSRADFSARFFCVPPAPAAPGPLACLAAPGPGARFGVRCARFGVRPAPVAYYRHALWRLAAAKSGTGAGRTFPPGSFVSINAPPFIPPPAPLPICPAPRPPARSGRLSRRHALDPGGPFSVLFLERGSRRNGSDRIGPPPTSSREAFTKEKDEKAEQLSRPRAAGRGGLSAGRPGDERAAAR